MSHAVTEEIPPTIPLPHPNNDNVSQRELEQYAQTICTRDRGVIRFAFLVGWHRKTK